MNNNPMMAGAGKTVFIKKHFINGVTVIKSSVVGKPANNCTSNGTIHKLMNVKR